MHATYITILVTTQHSEIPSGGVIPTNLFVVSSCVVLMSSKKSEMHALICRQTLSQQVLTGAPGIINTRYEGCYLKPLSI